MKVINNNNKIKVNVGVVIKYWDKTSPYPRYAMIIKPYEQGYSAVILSDKACPDYVGHVSLTSIQRYTSDNPTTVFQSFVKKGIMLKKCPFSEWRIS